MRVSKSSLLTVVWSHQMFIYLTHFGYKLQVLETSGQACTSDELHLYSYSPDWNYAVSLVQANYFFVALVQTAYDHDLSHLQPVDLLHAPATASLSRDAPSLPNCAEHKIETVQFHHHLGRHPAPEDISLPQPFPGLLLLNRTLQPPRQAEK